MRRNERIDDESIAQLSAFKGMQAGLWTAMPAIVKSFNVAKMTAEVQPTIQARVTGANGVPSWVTLPLLVDCPVVFPSGGGFALTFPIKDGDECLVVFASRCIDAWWQSSGVQAQADLRMHDLSDGFVIPGPRSVPRALASVSTTDVVLRNDSGTSKISIKVNGDVDIVTASALTVTAPTTTITGDVVITGVLIAGGKNVGGTHTHTPVNSGLGHTGAPT